MRAFTLIVCLHFAALGVIAASVAAMAPVDASEGPAGLVVGRVVSTIDERPVMAHLAVLSEGAFPVTTVVTNAVGEFEIELLPGVYDLRAVDVAGYHVAGIRRDVLVREDLVEGIEVRLDSIDSVLESLGVDAVDTLDDDGDSVADSLEHVAGIDPFDADSNADSVTDGVAIWVDADPASGPALTTEQPIVRRPFSGASIPIARGYEPAPVPLLFDAVPGATGYRMTLHSTKDGRAMAVDFLSFDGGDLVIGEGVATRWTPPRWLAPGPYELRLQGFHGDPGFFVGIESTWMLEIVEVEPEPIEVIGDVVWSGMVARGEIIVRSGVTVTVPAGESLRFVAFGNLIVEEGAAIRGASGDPEDGDLAGASLSLSASGDVVVSGMLSAGTGCDREILREETQPGVPSHVEGEPGGAGGDVMIVAHGTLYVPRSGRIASGTGGRGADAEARSTGDADAFASGGDGGAGGSLIALAYRLRFADRPGIVSVGEGGAGGDARAFGSNGRGFTPPGLGTALGGVGGPSGDVWLSDWDLREDGVVHLAGEGWPVSGGRAGKIGDGEFWHGGWSELALDLLTHANGRDHAPPKGKQGFAGWYAAGEGQTVQARGGSGVGLGKGGTAVAEGGEGGPVTRLGLGRADLGRIFAYLPHGGVGGVGMATGGVGGAGVFDIPHARPGDGGDAMAYGGAGGWGLAYLSPIRSLAGAGGAAFARGGPGQVGRTNCAPPSTGGDGSRGGVGVAWGGPGGDAAFVGGAGGPAEASGGIGGVGGGGLPPGRGGFGGNARASDGDKGRGAWMDGETGVAAARIGRDGPDGPECARAPR